MRRLLLLTSLLALTFPSPAFVQSLDAGPALWVLCGQGATVSLFGRMGVRADTDWLTPKIAEAFDTGGVLWLENPSTDPAATGKEIRSEWSDLRALIQFSAALPDTTHLQMIRKALNDSSSYEEFLDARLNGDVVALSKWSTDFAAMYPQAYRRINSERNAKWEGFVEEMLAQGGTQFVSVGFGHVSGPDSILSRLESAGSVVERL